ncbi:HlyD family efflux transporter periplasmic adaptor subunit, partial [Nonlabens mediterrranea]|nr:HlyD family efflux transporter periplasmic adaptor subunit [Nonlabens mediterrranea]
VPETEISQIKKETEVQVTISSIQQTLTGKVKEVSTSAQQTGGQYLVKITIDKTDVPVLSGMFATIALPVERKATNDNVLIPATALITKGQLTGVYTISENNTAMLRWLRLGRTLGDQVEILSGLNANEKYITSSNGKLFNGAKVTIQ